MFEDVEELLSDYHFFLAFSCHFSDLINSLIKIQLKRMIPSMFLKLFLWKKTHLDDQPLQVVFD